jgi:hypothetical protein
MDNLNEWRHTQDEREILNGRPNPTLTDITTNDDTDTAKLKIACYTQHNTT